MNGNSRLIFWRNIDRYVALRGMTFNQLAQKTKQNYSALQTLRTRQSNIGIESMTKYANALDIQLVDLLEDWTDEEWESYLWSQSNRKRDESNG